MKKQLFSLLSIALVGILLLAACGNQPPAIADDDRPVVVASTTMVGDVVKQIAGDTVNLVVLFPVGADPHTFEPRPQDVAAISNAAIIFLNGLELEHSLEPVIDANAKGTIVEVSEGVTVLPFNETHEDVESEEEHDHSDGDPHTWMDPNLVKIWVINIEKALSESAPQNSALYRQNAEAYTAQLTGLDEWIKNEIAAIPVENRKLVTDHEALGYFIHQYDFSLVGLVVDSLSTNASPSAAEISALEKAILEQQVKAIFVGTAVNPSIARQVAKDTGVQLIPIQIESLGEAGSNTDSYLKYMRNLVTTLVNGLQ